MKPSLAIIGTGFSGLAAAVAGAKNDYKVDVYEKFSMPGGRARQFSHKGFRFDMGPSWYWMPDVIDDEFQRYGYTTSDFFELNRLDPSYSVFWDEKEPLRVPADFHDLIPWLEQQEPGSSRQLNRFLEEARQKYHLGMRNLAQHTGIPWRELLSPVILKQFFRLNLFKSMRRHIGQHFSDPRIRQLLSFPVLFLGGTPAKLPALYSLMNYADLKLGSWYPMGGMYKLVDAWYQMARESGVQFHFNTEIQHIRLSNNRVTALHDGTQSYAAEALIATGDYHHIEQHLLPPSHRQYSKRYWNSRTMAPSCLIFYLGLNRRIPGLTHHNLFFDEDFQQHASNIYENPSWPERPLFYACCPSKTDPSTAPEGMENLFLLIPVAPALRESNELHNYYFNLLEKRLQKHIGIRISDHLIFKQSYGIHDFEKDYHAFKGNAYGMANTLKQTSILKPSMQHSKIPNMVYAGQLTQPGPGIPPCLLSGRMAVEQITKKMSYEPD